MRHDEPATMMHLIRPLLLLIGVIVLLLVAERVAADSVRIHDVTGSDGPDITLEQVAELQGEYANTFAGLVVGRFDADQTRAEVEASAIVKALRDGGAKLGRIDLSGFGKCTVLRTFTEPVQAEADTAEQPVANAVDSLAGQEPVTVYTPTTVKALIEHMIAERTGIDPSALSITFRDKDIELLRSSAVAGRYEVEPVLEPGLGKSSFKVYAYRGTRQVGNAQLVTADVARRVIAVIATTPIARGTLINRRQVRLREVLIDDPMQVYLNETALVVGQVASKTLSPGDLVTASEIRMPVAVRKRERVAVELMSRGVKITFNGIAQEAGSVGDTIEVVNPNSQGKERFKATIVGRGKVAVGPDMNQNKPENKENER